MEGNGTLTLPDEATLYNEDIIGPCDSIGEARLAQKIRELGYPRPGDRHHVAQAEDPPAAQEAVRQPGPASATPRHGRAYDLVR